MKPICYLSSVDGNVFSIIYAVRKTLNRAGQKEQIDLFDKEWKQTDDYYKILVICSKYVEIV